MKMKRKDWQRISALATGLLSLLFMLNALGYRILPVELFVPVWILLLAAGLLALFMRAKAGE